MRKAIPLLLLQFLAGSGASGQATSPISREIALVVGKGELLHYDREIVRVVIAEPKIADAIVVSPHDVMVSAKGAGQTTLVVWETDVESPSRYEITVANDTITGDVFDKRLAADLRSALPDSGIEFSGNADALVLRGKASSDQAKRAEALAAAHSKKVVNLIEVPEPRQILLQVKFASVDRIGLQQLGFNLFSRNDKNIGATSTQQFQTPLFSQLQFQNNELANTNINLSNLLNLFLFRPDLNIGATIQALEQRNLLQILAEPNLIVVEGASASFLAGGEFPFPTITSTPTGGGIAPVVTVQFKKFGVQLDFTPTVTAADGISLRVRPEVSALDFTNAVTLQGFLIPAISSRVAETQVVLKDGESFAIAGLIDNRVTQVLNKVRGLGDVPVLGKLFRSRATQKSTDELLVVITPRFVRPLGPDERAKLPETLVPFLPTVPEQKAEDESKTKGKKAQKGEKKPEFVGPRGHEVPK